MDASPIESPDLSPMPTPAPVPPDLVDARRGRIDVSSWLMDAQCWLWGQDIRRPAGNLLIAYGLRRDQWDEGGHATHYRGDLGDTAVVLWSGGMVVTTHGVTVEVPRHHLQPRLRAVPVHDEGLVDPRRTHQLMGTSGEASPLALDEPRALRAFLWLHEYESWVAREAPGWRSECAARWLEAEEQARELAASVGVDYEPLPPLPSQGLAEHWGAFAAVPPASGAAGGSGVREGAQ